MDSRLEIGIGSILDVGLGLPVGMFGIRISEFRVHFDWELIWEICFVCFCLFLFGLGL